MTSVRSLWPAQIRPDILSPRQILSAQANALTELTSGVLVGELSESKRENNEVILTLDIVAPAIKYRHRVLTASHSTALLYPVRIDADVFKPKGIGASAASNAVREIIEGRKPESRADSDDELVKLVEKVLTSPEVVSMAQSLIALSNEARTPTNYIEHLRGLAGAERQSAIDAKIAETYHEIFDSEAFGSAIAETNASGWGMDEYEIEDIDLGDEECLVKLSYSASGDQDEDRVYSGARVIGNAEAVINSAGTVEYHNITAEVAHDSGEQESDGDPGQET